MKLKINILCGVLIWGLVSSFAMKANAAARIIKTRGDIFVNGASYDGANADIAYGSEIEARGKGSFVQVLVDKERLVRIVNGKIKINPIKDNKMTVNQYSGSLFCSIQKKLKNDKKKVDFVVKSNVASMAVRGTKFFSMITERSTYLCVCEGEVEFSNLSGKASGVVQAGYDSKLYADDNDFRKSKASDAMWTMSREAFQDMGVPIQ